MKAIIATDTHGGIGKNNTLPWPRIEGDLPRFKALTMGHPIIMGRNTWESLPKRPLPGRLNVVITSKPELIETSRAVESYSDIGTAVAQYPDAWLIGGAQLINSSWDLITELHLSSIDGDYNCDTFIDLNYIREHFTPIRVEYFDNYTYEIWTRDATV